MDKKEAMNTLICHKHNVDAWVTSLRMTRCPEEKLFCDVQISDALDVAIEALEKADKYRWHDLRKNPDDLPPVEKEVEIAYGESGQVCIAFYEDGTVHSEDSDWCFSELSDWCEYCDETDDYIIPKMWISYNPFAENFGEVVQKVIAWREIEAWDESRAFMKERKERKKRDKTEKET